MLYSRPDIPFLLTNFEDKIAQSAQGLGYWMEDPMSNLGSV
jgi:hypothetical protein